MLLRSPNPLRCALGATLQTDTTRVVQAAGWTLVSSDKHFLSASDLCADSR